LFDLNDIAEICAQEILRFHIDGAIGAIDMLSDKKKPQLKGIEKADSVVLDLHKWMPKPFEVGCVMLKESVGHKNTFSLNPEYLAKNTRGLASGENWFSEYGLKLSRLLRALKVWMSLKEHGSEKFSRVISRNVDQAYYLGKIIHQQKDLELLAPIGLDIVCFRYNPGSLSLDEINALNKEIKLPIEERAIAFQGYTTVNGMYYIRCAISSHQVTNKDFDELVKSILRIGKEDKF
jgi:glutamate/tyrosine decarboxylase-like PLP-dependent enzyme